jgi:hypothetical protein
MAFAFSDATGKRVLVAKEPNALADPRALQTAICADGRIAGVSYLWLQLGDPEDTGRQTAHNFDHLEGHLYSVTSSGGVAANATCLLTTADFGRGARAVALAAGRDSPCPRDLVEPLERTAKARAGFCFGLGPAAEERGVAVAFVKDVPNPTAFILYRGPSGVFVKEIRAAGKYEATSCWRADDECKLTPDAYRLVVVHAGGTTRLIVLGAAPEGENAELAELRDGKIVGVLQAYRYWNAE